MAGRGKLLAIGAVLSLVVGVAATTSLAGNDARTASAESISFNFDKLVRGKIRGLVVARQANSDTSVRVYISLHALMPNRRYRIGAYAKPCSQVVDAGDLAIWRRGFRTVEVEDMFVTGIVRRRGKLSSEKSLRIFDLDNRGGPSPVACASGNEVAIESLE